MTGDLLDIAIVVLAILFAARGYRRGLLVGAASLIGFVGGAVLGTRIAGPLVPKLASGTAAAFLGLLIVLVVAVLAQELLVYGASVARSALRFTPLRAVDGIGGALLSVAALLFVAWLLGLAVVGSPFSRLAYQVRHSRVLTAVDAVVPNQLTVDFSAFLRLIEQHALPPVFGGLAAPPDTPVAPPAGGAVPASVILADAPSVLKVSALEPECNQASEGSGFVIAPDRVITNAHVVAGARRVRIVSDGTGRSVGLVAQVVLYDANRDVAVLDVPGLNRPALHFATAVGTRNDPAEVVGYPQNGPFTPVPARIRTRITASGPNIYSSRIVTRDVYTIRALVRPGNSGGPLLDPSGSVYGIVFATSTDMSDTGYVLTAAEVSGDAQSGAAANGAVGTGPCA